MHAVVGGQGIDEPIGRGSRYTIGCVGSGACDGDVLLGLAQCDFTKCAGMESFVIVIKTATNLHTVKPVPSQELISALSGGIDATRRPLGINRVDKVFFELGKLATKQEVGRKAIAWVTESSLGNSFATGKLGLGINVNGAVRKTGKVIGNSCENRVCYAVGVEKRSGDNWLQVAC